MEARTDPVLVALFGSETRVRTLAVLAGAYRPMTAYRVAKVGGVPIQKAYEEFRRLGRSGLVTQRESGWVLADADVRALLRKRVRIRWSDDLRAERAHNLPAEEALLHRLETVPHARPPPGWLPRDAGRFHRSPVKDKILRRMRRRTSAHAAEG